jgi:hypothetical protein
MFWRRSRNLFAKSSCGSAIGAGHPAPAMAAAKAGKIILGDLFDR